MNSLSRQAAIGAFTAAALMLGANAGANTQPGAASISALTIGTQLTQSYQGAAASVGEVLQIYRDEALGIALDALGEVAARLRQL